ncbi:UNVERIFIED_CONTAM: Regulatory protein NPR5 [Sesamum radiatum]
MVISREEGNASAPSSGAIYPPMGDQDHGSSGSSGAGNIAAGGSLNLDSRMVYLNLGAQMGGKLSEGEGSSSQRETMNRHDMYHHHSHDQY